MSQGRFISLRLSADNYSRKAQFCFDQKNWADAMALFQKAIDETMQIPRQDLNKDDYLLLALSSRDMVWPSINRDDVSGAFKYFRDSLTWFSLAVSELTGKQFSGAKYMDVLSSYCPIMAIVLKRLKPCQLTVENRNAFTGMRQAFADFLQETGKKFPQAKISSTWADELQWPSSVSASQSKMFDRLINNAVREEGLDADSVRLEGP